MSAPRGIRAALLPAIDSILNVRDAVGAVIEPVYFLTRTWYSNSGKTTAALSPEGFAKDSIVQLLPTPGQKNYSQDVRLKEGGAIKAGDIILTGISRNKYAVGDLDGTTASPNVEKFFVVGIKLYQTINVTEKYVTWRVQIRQLTNQTRY